MESKVLIFGSKKLTDLFMKDFDTNYKNYAESDDKIHKSYLIKTRYNITFQLITINIQNFEQHDQADIEYGIFDACINMGSLNAFVFLLDSESHLFDFLRISKSLKFMFKKELLKTVILCFMDFKKINQPLHEYQINQIESIMNIKLEKENYFINFENLKGENLKAYILKLPQQHFDVEEIIKEKLKLIRETHSKDLKYFSNMMTQSKDFIKSKVIQSNFSQNYLNEPFQKKLKIEESIKDKNDLDLASKNSAQQYKTSFNKETKNLNTSSTYANSIEYEKDSNPSNLSAAVSEQNTKVKENNNANLKLTNDQKTLNIQPIDNSKTSDAFKLNKEKTRITKSSSELSNNSFRVTPIKETKLFLILGEAGAGKSTFINYMANYFEGSTSFDDIISNPNKLKIAIDMSNWSSNLIERFSNLKTEKNIHDKTKSKTYLCSVYDFIDKNSGKQIKLIDSPGINDTEGNACDKENYEKIKKVCLQQSSFNGIIFVINGSKCRNDINMRNFIEFITQLLPDKFKRNILLVATNSNDTNCNFDFRLLEKVVGLHNIFYMQNSFFNWDKTKTYSDKALRTFRADWEDSISAIRTILDNILFLDSISNEIFSKIDIHEINIVSKLKNILSKSLKELFESYTETKLHYAEALKILDELVKNVNKRNYYAISAIKNGYNTTLYTSLPDNASVYRYGEYTKQWDETIEKKDQLNLKIPKIENEIENILNEMKNDCNRLKQLNKHFNFAEKFGNEYKMLCKDMPDKSNHLIKNYLARVEYYLGFNAKY